MAKKAKDVLPFALAFTMGLVVSMLLVWTIRSLFTSGNVNLLVLIFSRPDESGEKLRSAIRSSWVSQLRIYKTADYRFIIPVGAAIERQVPRLQEEQEMHGDILFVAEVVTPSFSSKQLLISLDWSMSRHFRFLLKVNEASFVDIKSVLEAVARLKMTHLIWGYFRGNEIVNRSGPHSESNWNLCRTFLPYPEGGGYVLSRSVVEMLTTMGPDLEHMDNEDAAVGVWTAPFEHITRKHDTRFNTGLRSRGCHNHYFISHPENVSGMVSKHSSLIREGKICEMEFQLVQGYQFEWNSPPYNCCIQNKDIP